jgi:hypothetical protein
LELSNRSLNSDRCLVLFDSGACVYQSERDLQPLIDSTSWPLSRLSFDHCFFLRNYFHSYPPERDLLRLKLDQRIQVYHSTDWHQAKVIQLDASLAKLEIQMSKHTFWIYRGSFCLWPIYEKFFKKLLVSNSSRFEVKMKYLVEHASSRMPPLFQMKSNAERFVQNLVFLLMNK